MSIGILTTEKCGPTKLELIIFHNVQVVVGLTIAKTMPLTNSWKKCKFHARYNNTHDQNVYRFRRHRRRALDAS